MSLLDFAYYCFSCARISYHDWLVGKCFDSEEDRFHFNQAREIAQKTIPAAMRINLELARELEARVANTWID